MKFFAKISNKVLSFLDILIKNEGNRFLKLVYRKKKTPISLFTQFNNLTPMNYTVGIVRYFIHRAIKISFSCIVSYQIRKD